MRTLFTSIFITTVCITKEILSYSLLASPFLNKSVVLVVFFVELTPTGCSTEADDSEGATIVTLTSLSAAK